MLDEALSGIEFKAQTFGEGVSEFGVKVGVIADLVLFRVNAAKKSARPLDVCADHEEGGGHSFTSEYVENSRCVAGIGAVVERQSDLVDVVGAGVGDEIRRGIAFVGLHT